MTSLTAILRDMMTEADADNIRLNDGAATWDIYNLLIYSDDDNTNYSRMGDAIYAHGDDGRQKDGAAYTITRDRNDNE